MIWSVSFFAWCTQPDVIESYRKTLDDAIFSCIETLKQGYVDISLMPIKRFYDLLKWKADLEDQKEKLIEEAKNK